jgi:hypothetical protein
MDKSSVFNQIWNFIFGSKPKDTLGLGNSKKGKLIKFRLGGSNKVGGVLCSTNPDIKGPSLNMVKLKCNSVLLGNNEISMAVQA